jgi:hypothetical protein
MGMRYTMKRDWKSVLAIATFFALSAYGITQLYFAWTLGTVRSGIGRVSYEANPILFIGIVTLLCIGTVVATGLSVGGLWGWRVEQLFFRRRGSRPPLDNAIREPSDPRS